ncbi:MAG: Cd(II)/Pb(II)-responsive transcriptional regulator [Rubrivivax sp.]|nr:Cd(II)/Pb(II)-responsive transcriptional regulator [Rubrivivax sp.]
MKIGDLAATTETPVETIRYYERAGLLAAPARSGGNYRLYGEAHVQRLAFIRRCRALDMTLDEVRALLDFIDAPGPDCARVDALLDEHIGHVTQRIAELKRLQGELRVLRARCAQLGSGAECGILQGLLAQGPPPRARAPASGGHPRGVHGAAPRARKARAGAASHKARRSG